MWQTMFCREFFFINPRKCCDKEHFLLLSLTEIFLFPFDFHPCDRLILLCFLLGTSVVCAFPPLPLSTITHICISECKSQMNQDIFNQDWLHLRSSIWCLFSLNPVFINFPWSFSFFHAAIAIPVSLPWFCRLSPMCTAVSESRKTRLYINEPNQSHSRAHKREYCFVSFSSFRGHLMFL